MQFDRGYITPYMVTDTEKMEAVLDDALILITDKKVSNIQELPAHSGAGGAVPARSCWSSPRTWRARPLSTLIVNKLRGTLNVVCVKAPGFGDRRKEMLEDIAVLTGGTVITSDMGYELKEATMDMLGKARQVKVSKENTIIVDGGRLRRRHQGPREPDPQPDRDHHLRLRPREAPGAPGQDGRRRGHHPRGRRYRGGDEGEEARIEDALNATRAAVEEGIVAGGGTAYVNAVSAVEKLVNEG